MNLTNGHKKKKKAEVEERIEDDRAGLWECGEIYRRGARRTEHTPCSPWRAQDVNVHCA